MIRNQLGEAAWKEIEEQTITLSSNDDKATSILSNDGLFSFKSCWNLIRARGRISFMWRQIWNANSPKMISFFLWRILHENIACYTMIQMKGIPLASRYHYRVEPSIESIDHLLIRGDIAKEVWGFFSGRLGIQMQFFNIQQALYT